MWKIMISSRAGLALGLAVTMGLLAACSDGTEPKDSEPHPAASSESHAPSGDNGDLADPVGARADLTGFRCVPKGQKRWAASGVVVNDTETASDYLIRVSVVVSGTSEVIVSREQDLAVAAGGREKFALKGLRARTGDGVECAVRVVRSASR